MPDISVIDFFQQIGLSTIYLLRHSIIIISFFVEFYAFTDQNFHMSFQRAKPEFDKKLLFDHLNNGLSRSGSFRFFSCHRNGSGLKPPVAGFSFERSHGIRMSAASDTT